MLRYDPPSPPSRCFPPAMIAFTVHAVLVTGFTVAMLSLGIIDWERFTFFSREDGALESFMTMANMSKEDAKEFEKIMQGYHDLVDFGRREVYKIEG